MPYLASDYTDSLVFIFDSNNDPIVKTIITGCNRDEMYIEVSEGLRNVKPGTRLHLIVFHSTGASEFGGVYRSVRQGIFEISIYGERQREARASTRHRLDAPAVVRGMAAGAAPGAAAEPHHVTIENMSTTGVLIVSEGARYEIGAPLQIEFTVNERKSLLYANVIREEAKGEDLFSYGCRLNFNT